MDLEAFWQTHKRFVIKVAGGALLLLVGNAWQSSVQGQADRLARANASAQNDLVSMIEALRGAEGLERGRTDTLEQRLAPAIHGAILWRPEATYQLKPGQKSPQLFYTSAVEKAAVTIRDLAQNDNADVPRDAKGLGLKSEVELERVPEALAQVDVVENLVSTLIKIKVPRVLSVAPGEVSYESLGSAKPEEGAPQRWLRVVRVKVTFSGTTRTLASVLHEVQQPNQFLEVVGCEVERESDKPGAGITATLDLQALEVVDALPASAKVSDGAPARGGRKGPRRTFVRER